MKATLNLPRWTIEEETGYKPQTTFWEDFSIADIWGAPAVQDTYHRGLVDAETMGYEALTEFVMVLNWKIWQHYYAGHSRLAQVYDTLWRAAAEYAVTHLTGDALTYYYITTD